MAHYDADNVIVSSPELDAREAQEKERHLSSLAGWERQKAEIFYSLPLLGEGYEIVYPGHRMDGQECPKGTRKNSDGDETGKTWVSFLDKWGYVGQVIAYPKHLAAVARKKVQDSMYE